MGSRRATDCIAGDKPVDADSPAPGRRVRDLPTAGVPAAGASFLTGAGNRRWAFSLPGKTGAQRGHAPGKNRVRARLKCRHKHGDCPAQPRDLPTAGVPAAGAGVCRAFCLSNLFSFVAQAATGIPLLVPSRGFVSGLRVLSPAAFSRTFAPIACLPVLRCSHGFSLLFFSCFFALSCLTSSSQTSFHLSLRPRRASTFFRKAA